MYYLCSENKGADQLPGYPEADLRLFAYAKRWFSRVAAQMRLADRVDVQAGIHM